MKTETIVMCVVALILGMLMANMLKSVCGCKVVEGNWYNVGCMTTEKYIDSDNWRAANDTCRSRYTGDAVISSIDTYNEANNACSGGALKDNSCRLVSTN